MAVRNLLKSPLLTVCATCLTLGSVERARAQFTVQDPLYQHYQHVLYDSTLEWLFSDPFDLKVDFELYDLNGSLSEKGTAEEYWTQSEGKVIRIKSPSFPGGGEGHDGTSLHMRESFLVHQALNAIARPFPTPEEHQFPALKEFTSFINGLNEECFSVTPPSSAHDSDVSYCTNSNNGLIAISGPFYVVERTDLRKYHGHEVPNDLKITYEGRTALTMHVSELDPLPKDQTAKPADKIKNNIIPASILAGRILKKKQPSYPKEARKKKLGGTVIIIAVISKEGTIADLDVLASPDPLLTKAAVDAVKTWTYSPYLLNNEPTAIDTTIMVNFNINP